ncbi:hypothetical protein ScalyP_jg7318, partial [Parmales sp. scaly parma]
FVHQMSIQLALFFPQSALNQTIATRSYPVPMAPSLSVPELASFRDIVFYFKHSVSGTSPCNLDPKTATLHTTNFLPAHDPGVGKSGSEESSKSKSSNAEDGLPCYTASAFVNTNQNFVNLEDETN